MPATNISIYLTNEEYPIYLENQELLHQKAREAFEKELFRIKEALAKFEGVAPIVETLQEDAVHKKSAENRAKRESERLYRDEMRHNNGRKGGML